jgi:WD40 repeat protein
MADSYAHQWLDWHPKGNVLLAGGADGTVWVWNRKRAIIGLLSDPTI